jgi:hypothetical protein
VKYCIAVKLKDYSAEFSFDSAGERDEFIAVTQAQHPAIEFIVSETWVQKVASA